MSDIFPDLPSFVKTEFISVEDDVQIRVLRAGSGSPILFVPGWSLSAEVFVHQFIDLSKDHEVIAIDPRGHGKSSKPLTGNNYAARARDLDAVINALNLENLTLAGWSFGVLDVLSYVRDFGHKSIEKLVLIDQAPRVPLDPNNPEEWGAVPLTQEGMPGLILSLVTNRDGFLFFVAADSLGVDMEAAATDAATQKMIADGEQTPEHIAVIMGVEGFATDLSETAKTYNDSGKPLMFFSKEGSAEEAKRWLGKNLSSARFATIPVHAGFMTEPEIFNGHIREFLG